MPLLEDDLRSAGADFGRPHPSAPSKWSTYRVVDRMATGWLSSFDNYIKLL
ncbi:hypothetical protein H634G_06694 [Metarhizium anisopliae BRIP 53293]|uniref:Uncharacterized protein n=1 Tax=Metarhizium anisopliae BRIP 53293 TaxID=1291518 RepID=A0A0D9NWA4_METAN|nr:hypothetical protein H634G_06694 [Metarhizium anisopliae BRIP 53293]